MSTVDAIWTRDIVENIQPSFAEGFGAASVEHRTLKHRISNRAFCIGRSSFAFAPARQVGACHAEAFGVGGFGVRRSAFASISFLAAIPRRPILSATVSGQSGK